MQEFTAEKSRAEGELSSLQKQRDDLLQKCKAEFDCESTELPALMEALDATRSESTSNAEIILGLREGTVTSAPAPSVVVEEKAQKQPPPPQPDDGSEGSDDDGIIPKAAPRVIRKPIAR